MIEDGYTSERADIANRKEGLLFELEFPQFANVTCQQCREWWWDPELGRMVRGSEGEALRRPMEATILCETEVGCRRGHYVDPKGLSPKNREAVAHYKRCRAAGVFPDDPIVQRNKVIIEDILHG